MIPISPYLLAERFIGTKEIPGSDLDPQVLAFLRLDHSWPENDEVPWCSGFTNYVCWLLRLPRSKSLMARSWLDVGRPIAITKARIGFDVVILWRGSRDGASGHVGFFAGHDGTKAVYLLGGNQGDAVNVRPYPRTRILGVRRLWTEEGDE